MTFASWRAFLGSAGRESSTAVWATACGLWGGQLGEVVLVIPGAGCGRKN
jgi:hypothetical protein